MLRSVEQRQHDEDARVGSVDAPEVRRGVRGLERGYDAVQEEEQPTVRAQGDRAPLPEL
jgi:hypothetical protein